MKILFIGGNGNISWYCVQEALKRGHEVFELNRSETLRTRREIQPQVHKITCDMRNKKQVIQELSGSHFDVVCDFICFNEEHAQLDIEVFANITKHYIYISSEAVYKRKGVNLPFREDCEKNEESISSNYIAGKLKAEELFNNAYKENGFPVTIIRPAYTYDVIIPVSIGHNCYTAAKLFLEGYPALIAGDGTNLWSFTHSSDFATAFVKIAENPDTIGEAFHIATDEWLTWNEEMEILFHALAVPEFRSIHIPYQEALELSVFQPKDLMFQRMWHNIYDTSKVKDFIPGWRTQISFEEGIQKTVNWLNQAEERRRVNHVYLSELQRLYTKYKG